MFKSVSLNNNNNKESRYFLLKLNFLHENKWNLCLNIIKDYLPEHEEQHAPFGITPWVHFSGQASLSEQRTFPSCQI